MIAFFLTTTIVLAIIVAEMSLRKKELGKKVEKLNEALSHKESTIRKGKEDIEYLKKEIKQKDSYIKQLIEKNNNLAKRQREICDQFVIQRGSFKKTNKK